MFRSPPGLSRAETPHTCVGAAEEMVVLESLSFLAYVLGGHVVVKAGWYNVRATSLPRGTLSYCNCWFGLVDLTRKQVEKWPIQKINFEKKAGLVFSCLSPSRHVEIPLLLPPRCSWFQDQKNTEMGMMYKGQAKELKSSFWKCSGTSIQSKSNVYLMSFLFSYFYKILV